jgi:signal transduction histidine kinase
MADDIQVRIAGDDDIVVARSRARELARQLGFGAVDQSRIATAVSELTRNVVRYATDGRGRVAIRALEPSVRGTGIEIVVADDGPGMTEEEAARAFDRFWQAGGDASSSGRGTGLGLSIVAAVAEAHHGRARAEPSTDGNGARFVVELPLGEAPDAADAVAAADVPDAAPPPSTEVTERVS